MNQSEDDDSQDLDSTLDRVEIIDAVREIFDDIFDGPMEQFKEPLEFIKENRFGSVWGDDTERHEKVMRHANTFLQAVSTRFSSQHAEASKHIEGSTCDLFLPYLYEKLDESLLGQEPFEDSCNYTKELITSKILRIKGALESQHDEQPKQKSDLEVMISQTDLLDPIHIHHALLCCQVAYNCEDPECSKESLEDLEKEHLLSELSVSYENEQVPKYVMARCGDVLYVSFKGVQAHNFGSTERSYRGEICTGVNKAAEKIPLKYFAREIIQNKRLVFSGHSSGGAVASLVFLFLLEKFKHQQEEFLKSHFKCITFGLMPLADNLFKQYVESIPGARDCFCHIVQKDDIVPKLFGSFNMTHMQNKLWELVENVLAFSERVGDPAGLTTLLQFILASRESLNHWRGYGISHLDIFGMYYVLDTSKPEQKYSVLPASEKADQLRFYHHEGFRHMRSQYLINHKIERYAHEVELALLQELPNLNEFKSTCNMEISDDMKPKVTEVRFENIGEDVVAKIAGSSMWFVYNVSIEGVNGNGKDLKVDVMKSSESEVQTRMPVPHIVHKEEVSVRVKTHFQNSKFLGPTKVPAKTTTYMVSRRQQQLAKHSPRGVIELAYLSALLERRGEGYQSKRLKAIKTFFESAVSVVPLESLFHAIANAKPDVVVQCCEIFSSGDDLLTSRYSSEFLLTSMERALSHISYVRQYVTKQTKPTFRSERLERTTRGDITSTMRRRTLMDDSLPISANELITKRDEYNQVMLNNAHSRIHKLVKIYKRQTHKQRRPHSPCNINLEVIYPSADVKETCKRKMKCCKAPMTLLTEGKKELNRLSEELISEHLPFGEESTSSSTNVKMLSVLTNLRKEFETCSTLLGAFMESQVQIPLEKAGGDKYVNKFAKHASSIGLSVWGLLVVPFEYLNRLIINNLSEDFRQFVVEFSRHIRGIRNHMFSHSEQQFPDYEERLEFLVGSMKQSWACNQQYVSYSLERQLEDQCKKRNIYHDTPVDEILNQWNDNFDNETLTLVPNEYRPLVARWIRWSLMINDLRESLASQIAVGVVGLVNSGKSKFVRSMFRRETITGTTDQKRTTVPLIYNLSPDIKGMDVIDFPGVDDRDKSIPDLAELLLSLTRIVVFVVDYRRAHTESTKQWLNILDKENVPVLICLSFADKLFAELMGKNEDFDIEKVKAGVEKQLNTIKEVIGQPESGHQRDFKLTVFSFDNDSKLNTEEGKEKLRKAGLCDELDVGRWIAEKLQDYEENDVSQNVIKFIEEQETSTLNSHRRTTVPAQPTAEEKTRQLEKTNTDTHVAKHGQSPRVLDNPRRRLEKTNTETHVAEHGQSPISDNPRRRLEKTNTETHVAEREQSRISDNPRRRLEKTNTETLVAERGQSRISDNPRRRLENTNTETHVAEHGQSRISDNPRRRLEKTNTETHVAEHGQSRISDNPRRKLENTNTETLVAERGQSRISDNPRRRLENTNTETHVTEHGQSRVLDNSRGRLEKTNTETLVAERGQSRISDNPRRRLENTNTETHVAEHGQSRISDNPRRRLEKTNTETHVAEHGQSRISDNPRRRLENTNTETHVTKHGQSRVLDNPRRRSELDRMPSNSRRETGCIKKFFKDRGYGFIHAAGIEEGVFFRKRQLMSGVIPSVGSRVSFRLSRNQKGLIAENIENEHEDE